MPKTAEEYKKMFLQNEKSFAIQAYNAATIAESLAEDIKIYGDEMKNTSSYHSALGALWAIEDILYRNPNVANNKEQLEETAAEIKRYLKI